MKNFVYIIAIIIIVILINDYMLKFRPIVHPFKRRKCDAFGCGSYGASRDSGKREHKGLDILSTPGQPVFAPFGGKVRTFRPYPDYPLLDGVSIQGKAYTAKTMYVLPVVKTGDRVRAGQLVGYAQSLQVKYPGISDHIHQEIWLAGTSRNPDKFFPPDSLI